MAAEYRIYKPYVLTTLPRPLDHTDGRIVAREVYGQREGQKKRKRTELAVGVDGETASIYDVPASRLITSYPIPPQESFACPPYSVRIRRLGSTDVSRYTFIATRDAAAQKLTLFKDVVHPDGKTTSTTASQILKTSPVRYLTCASAASQTSAIGDIMAVCQNGEFVSLAGETLAIQWTSSSKFAVQDVVASAIDEFEVDYVVSGTTAEFSEGIFKNRPEAFSAMPRSLSVEPEVFALVSRSFIQGQESRHLIVLAALLGGNSSSSELQRLTPLDVVPIASPTGQLVGTAECQVDLQSGVLLQLQQGALSVYDLTSAVPKLRSIVQMDGAHSFVARLSRPFVMSCSLESIGLYNHQYRSVHANSTLDLSDLPAESQEPRTIQLISYMRSQDLVVALVDNVLVAIRVEPPKSHGKRRKEGLLIDSIGRGTAVEIPTKKLKWEKSSLEFSRQIPGTMTETYLAKYHAEIEAADEFLSNEEFAKWEKLLRRKFRVARREASLELNAAVVNGGELSDVQEPQDWEWLSDPSQYPAVDRRWAIYAISQVFSLDLHKSSEAGQQLRLILPDSNVTTYLVVAGHLTLSNLQSAFREELEAGTVDSRLVAGDLIHSLIEADPSMTLLLNYLQATKLGEVEVLLAIRALMMSMDLIRDTEKQPATKLLTNEAHDNGDKYEMDLDELEREIAATEHYLGDDSSSRSRGLTLAFTKLWRLPAMTTAKALRSTLQPEEVFSLILLLRVELVRGAWTSLYVDPISFDSEGNDPPPDGVITLIADLLSRCLDAVGAGGWLFDEAADNPDAGDFLTALKLEVTAALEGLEEAVYLNGIVGEAVRFGFAAQKSGVARPQPRRDGRPVALQLEGRESRLLPLGLKTRQLPTKDKVVSGGEVVQRSMRETGHLISQKVEAYSLERVAV